MSSVLAADPSQPWCAPFDVRPVALRLARISTPFARDVLAGLSRPRKAIAGRWLYDRRGCELFGQIAMLDDNYPTRTETAILEQCAAEIAALVGPGATLVELGRGWSRKAPLLLAALEAPVAYVPVALEAEVLAASMRPLRSMFPQLAMHPIVGDIADAQTLAPLRRSYGALRRAARSARPWGRRLCFMPGSTIGNFHADAAIVLLDRIGQALGDDSMLVVGVDSTLDRALLMSSHDDQRGVTATLNRNLLTRINRELEGDFDPLRFRHEARFDPGVQRVAMHLVSPSWQTVEVLGRRFSFAAGESIHTENAYKYSLTRFQCLAQRAGWSPRQFWSDGRGRFGVHVLERTGSRR
jgi:dimethylhistidine N-methyltransferase